MGYRLQLFSSANVDEANRRRLAYGEMLDGQEIELVFDAPFYKLRLGNFLDRKAAEAFRKELHEKGLTEAWIVRDHVTRTIRVREDQ